MGALDRVFRSRRPSQERPLAAIIARLWSNGEQGVWYDPSDLRTMYQDAAGTTPVYMPGQGQIDPPVGLLLDKRLGLTRGPELWVDARVQFFGEASRVAPGVYRVYTSAGAYTAVQISGLIAGEWYELSLNVDLITTLGNGLACDVTTPVVSFNSVGPKKYLLRTNTDVIAIKRNANVLTDIQISSVSVRRIPGNHAFQSTTTSRPTLSARYNLLTSSENLASTWAVFNGSVSSVVGYWKFTENASANLHSFLQTLSQPKAASYRASFVGKPAGRSVVRFVLNAYSGNFAEVRFNLATGAVVGVFAGEGGVVESYSIVPVEDGAYRCTIVGKPSAAATGTVFDVSLGMMDGTTASYTGDGVSGILVNYFDCRSANDGVGLPPYQRVINANTYDTMGFPLYLKFDGVDDWLRTSDIDFSGVTALFVAAAARKLSDAARGTLCELSSSYSNPGSFALEAPGITLNSFMFAHAGATTYKTLYRQLPAPVSAVVVGVSDLPSGYVRLSAKSPGYAQMSDVTTDVGGGSYATASLFIGRRAGSSQPFNGRLYSLLIRGAATTDATIAKVEGYLNQKAKVF